MIFCKRDSQQNLCPSDHSTGSRTTLAFVDLKLNKNRWADVFQTRFDKNELVKGKVKGAFSSFPLCSAYTTFKFFFRYICFISLSY